MQTPIRNARNLGPTTADELDAIGIHSLEQIKALGLEEFFARYTRYYPERLNLNAFCAVIGALNDQDWRALDPELKSEAKRLLQDLKRC